MIDWALAPGGRCEGKPWCVGVAGIDLDEDKTFLLNDDDWLLLTNILPIAVLQVYGDANGLTFERAERLSLNKFDSVLFVKIESVDKEEFILTKEVRQYLLLLETQETQETQEYHRKKYSRIFMPAETAFIGQHLIRLNQPLDIPVVKFKPHRNFTRAAKIFGRDKISVEQAHFFLCDQKAEVPGWLSAQWRTCLVTGVIPVHIADDPVPAWFPKDCFIDGTEFSNRAELMIFLDCMPWREFQNLEKRFKLFLMQDENRPDERIYPYTIDFWLNALTAGIALDASEVRQDAPLLSVIITAYNYGRFLKQTISSVLNQEVESLEILVLDNASTDDTLEVMKDFVSDFRVRYTRNRRNIGASSNTHNGIWIAKGRYLVMLMADDFMNPGHIARILPIMKSNPQVAVGYSPISWVDEQGQEIIRPKHPGHYDKDYIGGRNEIADLLVYDSYITPSATIVKRDFFFSTWQRDIRIRGSGDWNLMIQLAEKFPDFVFTTVPGVSYRTHPAQHSAEFYQSIAPLEGHVYILEGVLNRGNEDKLKGRELEIAEHLRRRLSYYPAEQNTELGVLAKSLCNRLEELYKKNNTFFFSVILTTYNRPNLLKYALESIEDQVFRDFEVILVNDFGKPVEHLLEEFSFPVTYIRQGFNQGISAARNAAIKLAKGSYICYLDDDDVYLPGHLKILSENFNANPLGVIYTNADYVNEVIENDKRIELSRDKPFFHKVFDKEKLFFQNYIPVNTFSHSRSLFDSVGVFDVNLTAFEDWDMLLRLAAKYSFICIPQVTAEVHLRDAPNTGSDHLLGREAKRFGALYQEIYRRHSDLNSERTKLGRQKILQQYGLAVDVQRPASDIRLWLEKRVLSPVQQSAFDQYIQNTESVFSVTVFILDPDGNTPAVETTLSSLVTASKGLKLSPVLLTPASEQWASFDGHVEFIDNDLVEKLNQQLQEVKTDWILVVTSGDELVLSGLLMGQLELSKSTALKAICFDVIYRQEDGVLGAALRPSVNLDYLLSFPAGLARNWLFNRDELLSIGGFDSSLPQAYELNAILRFISQDGLHVLGHIAEPLVIVQTPTLVNVDDERKAIEAHLQQRGYEYAELHAPNPGRYQVRYNHQQQPIVSIVLAAGKSLVQLQCCVDGLLNHTDYQNFEILFFTQSDSSKEVCHWLEQLTQMQEVKLRVIDIENGQLAEQYNQAATHAIGDYLLFLTPQVLEFSQSWLDELLNHAQRGEVGVVSAKLLNPDGKVIHAGHILGLEGPIGSPFVGETVDAAGYMQRLQVDLNLSAVGNDCFIVPRELFAQLDGFVDTELAQQYMAADFCLRASEAGYLIVWTPHAQLIIDRDAIYLPTSVQQDAMYEKWLPKLARDPAYNPCFSLSMPGGFKLADSQISWRPLDGFRPAPVALVHPADLFGCGHYRVMQPFLAMKEAGLVEGVISTGLMHVTDLERYNPDTIILQRQIGDERLEAMRRMKYFSNAFKVYELDDYLPNLPLKSVFRAGMPKDILRSLRKGLEFVDRFVVSTDALADAFAGLHSEIVVMENRLPLTWWGELQTQRNQGRKPRVGWAGGGSHTGDLELIADVVRDLADEVEWVFFGMCPDKLRPHIHEFHEGVAIEDYPRKLASLNLDLGLAPLEMNLFNECKSNLRLLEYGACGIPVICTDIRPYQNDFSVTRVRNRYKEWVDAIRMHLEDLDETARIGDALKAKVHNEWMLKDENVQRWCDAWLSR